MARTRRGRRRAALVLALLLAGGCAAGRPAADGAAPAVTEVYVISHGWHAGLALRTADLPPGLWPERRDFPAARWLEVGWGDYDYYQARNPGPGLALRAALWPTRGVLHTVGLRADPAEEFPASEVVALPTGAAGLARLAAFIDAAHDRRGGAPAAPLGPGLYGDSRYYPAHGRFHLLNTCNRWTARALAEAGHEVGPVLTAGQLMARVRRRAAALAPGGSGAGSGERDPGD